MRRPVRVGVSPSVTASFTTLPSVEPTDDVSMLAREGDEGGGMVAEEATLAVRTARSCSGTSSRASQGGFWGSGRLTFTLGLVIMALLKAVLSWLAAVASVLFGLGSERTASCSDPLVAVLTFLSQSGLGRRDVVGLVGPEVPSDCCSAGRQRVDVESAVVACTRGAPALLSAVFKGGVFVGALKERQVFERASAKCMNLLTLLNDGGGATTPLKDWICRC